MRDLEDFETSRSRVAERIFEEYAFGSATVAAANGWEISGHEWVRVLFFEADNPDDDSVKGHFALVFRPNTSSVVDAYAMIDGNLIGARGDEMSVQCSDVAPLR